jgi:two-component system cell cycle sensor histidine kinase/response regulator CckA
MIGLGNLPHLSLFALDCAEPGLQGPPPVHRNDSAISEPAMTAARDLPLAAAVLVAGLVFLLLGGLIGTDLSQVGLIAAGAILLAAAAILVLVALWHGARRRAMVAALARIVENDPSPIYLAQRDGRIYRRNRAAAERATPLASDSLAGALSDLMASPGAVLFRIQAQLQEQESAREDVVTHRGQIRIAAHRIDSQLTFWRLETVAEGPPPTRLAEGLGLPMLTAGPTGTILYMNEAFRRLAGGRPRKLTDIFGDTPPVSGRVQDVQRAEGTARALVAEVAGGAGRREIYLLPPEAAGQGGSATTLPWDMFEDLPVPLLRVSPEGIVLAANREARVLLPMPIGPGTRLSDLLEGLGRPLIDWLSDICARRTPPTPQFLRGTGQYQDTFLRVTLSLAGEGDDTHLIAVLNDVTEHKSLEAQFVQSQKMQAIGQLAGGVAHDFNNLLTAISGHCDLLLLRHDHADPDYGDLIQIHQNANRAASLVGQLLAFSRKQNLMLEIIDLRDAIADLTHLLNRLVGEKVTLTLTQEPALRCIRADKRQLEQVIMNLVVNARDAMPEGGEIRIETGNVTFGHAMERDRATVPAGDYVAVRVIDAGCGIPAEKLSKIFEPFYTTKRPGEGTGLGLSTAYGIVKQTGGYIFVDSTPGQGTTFTLYFPAHDRPVAEVRPPRIEPILPPPRKAEGVVLLVEDEAPVRAFASRALRLRGYSVLEADSAEAALNLLADPDLAVDLFVTDVIMPGKDGPTWVREALADRPQTKVVFVSGYAEDAFAEHKAAIPNSVFLPKPFSLNDLTTVVQRQLH